MNDWFEAEQFVEQAHEAYEAGRWGEAESALRNALELNPYQAEWHFNLGLTLEASGRYRDAVGSFEEAAGLQNDDSQSALMVAVNLLRLEEPAQTLEWLERAEASDPKSAAVQATRIDALARLGRHEQAELTFYLGQELDPDYPDLYAAMAESLLTRRQYDKAVWCLREAARLDPHLPRVQARLAYAYAATGRQERARQLYLRELREDPGDIDTLLDLGCLLVDMHRYTEGGEKFRRVLEMEPDNTDAHYYLGDLADRQGLNEEALVQFDVVLRLDSTYPVIRVQVAEQLIRRGREGDFKTARKHLRAELLELNRDPKRFEADDLAELGTRMLDADQSGDAVGVFGRLLERRPNDATAHHHLSVAYFRTGDVSRGIESARAALRLDPRCVPAMFNLAVANMRRRQLARARYWVDQALRVDPDDAVLRRLRLRLRFRVGGQVVGWVVSAIRRPRKRTTS